MSCSFRHLIRVLTTAMLVPWANWAHGQESTREVLTKAVVAKERAIDSNRVEDWLATLQAFQHLLEIRATAPAAYEVGNAAMNLGQLDVTVEAFELALELGLSGTAKAKAVDVVAEYAKQMARLTLFGQPQIEIVVRGLRRGTLPRSRPLVLLPGTTEILLFSSGHPTTRLELGLKQGESTSLRIESVAPKPAANKESMAPQLIGKSSSDTAFFGGGPRLPATTTGASAPFLYEHKSAFHTRETFGWSLLVTGAATGVVSLLFIPISGRMVQRGRTTLADNCEVQLYGPDSCAHAKIGRQFVAQSASDSIGAWQMVRKVSWIGLAVGAASVLGGGIILWPRTRSQSLLTMSVSSANEKAVELRYGSEF